MTCKAGTHVFPGVTLLTKDMDVWLAITAVDPCPINGLDQHLHVNEGLVGVRENEDAGTLAKRSVTEGEAAEALNLND